MILTAAPSDAPPTVIPTPRVYVVANDVVPGFGVTVAAPGLRCVGLADGLVANGIDAVKVMPKRQLRRRWKGDVNAPRAAGVVTISEGRLAEFLATRAPAVVIITNSNLIDHIPQRDGLAVILDVFAPRSLEVAFQSAGYHQPEMAAMRRRNLEALRRCEGVVINGEKKLAYYLGWLMQVDRDPRSVPVDIVPMTMPAGFAPEGQPRPEGPPRLVTAGYLQGWSRPGPWFAAIAETVEEVGAEFHVAMAKRQPGGDGMEGVDETVLDYLLNHPSIHRHGELLFDRYQQLLQRMDVAVDLFDWSLERELAMVTRTVGAIACGLPVVHPPWTETGALIARYDAGWLVDPTDLDAVRATLRRAMLDVEERAEKAANARRLWAEQFDPVAATRPLAAQIRALAPRLARSPESLAAVS